LPPVRIKILVDMREFELAKDKIMMGAERKSMVMSEPERLNTAYHEAGHAIVGRVVPEHDPVYKVSIIPRGRALGVTMFLPEEDKYSWSKRGIESKIASMFGGRIAEEITLGFDGVTTGASNDIQRATEMARSMVTKWGLSEKMGPLMYEEDEGEVFLGRSVTQHKNVSSQTAVDIDNEIRAIIDRCYGKAKEILLDNRDKLDMMAEALMQYETIDAAQIDAIMAGRRPEPPAGWGKDSGVAGGGSTPAGSANATAEKTTKPEGSSLDDAAGQH
jgi:cell division protease FtsH